MLEEIALSISTAIFFMCAFLVNGLVPQTPVDAAVPCEIIENADNFSLVGTWNSDGRTFEFTKSGKLIFNEQTMSYTVDGNTVTVTAEINGVNGKKNSRGTKRVYSVEFEMLDERVMKLGDTTFYRVK